MIRQHLFTGKFKEITTITTDIELRDGETIKINNREYKVRYKFNVDKKQHELYIDKVVELIVDEKLLKHAKIVCNEVIKKIIRYNRQVEKEMNKKNEEAQTKATNTITNDKTIQKDIDEIKLKWYEKLWNKFKSQH